MIEGIGRWPPLARYPGAGREVMAAAVIELLADLGSTVRGAVRHSSSSASRSALRMGWKSWS
jgi:hypothetical protein